MKKREKTVVDLDKPYEENEVGMRGIIYFGLGLFFLIVVTFGLMWALENFMEEQKKAEDERNRNPLARTQGERLPPEPRLQGAPGFGVDGPNGRINLELKDPRSEWWELQKIWKKELAEGKIVVSQDGKTRTQLTLPIEEAKKAILKENLKAQTGEEGEKALEEAKTFISAASSGRTRTERRR